MRPLHNMGPVSHPDLIVGIGGSDDAGVYRLTDDVALVQTVDFFTPVVDEPYDWGRIAAANALSDVYAMGGTPLTALQIVAWPRDKLPLDMLGEVMRGGVDVLSTASCTLLGGHSIDDDEPKYGMAVTGLVHPDEVVTNAAAKVGDVLVLTKALGTGIITTAIKRDRVLPGQRDAVVDLMATLNDGAARAMRRIGVRAATDVTGFGLLGHLGEIVKASGVSAVVVAADVPVLDGVVELAAEGVVPGGTDRNIASTARYTTFAPGVAEALRVVLADAQTSGGLLIAVDRPLSGALLQALHDENVTGAVVGEIVGRDFADGPAGRITVT